MAKPITASVAKPSITHHRVALKVTFPDGRVIKYSTTYSGDRFCIESPVGLPALAKSLTKGIFDYMNKFLEGENNGQKIERLAREFTGHKSIEFVPHI